MICYISTILSAILANLMEAELLTKARTIQQIGMVLVGNLCKYNSQRRAPPTRLEYLLPVVASSEVITLIYGNPILWYWVVVAFASRWKQCTHQLRFQDAVGIVVWRVEKQMMCKLQRHIKVKLCFLSSYSFNGKLCFHLSELNVCG